MKFRFPFFNTTTGVVLLSLLIVFFFSTCENNSSETDLGLVENATPASEVPHDVTASDTAYPQVTLTQLAKFAWKEFIALNHPADPNHRGQAAAGSTFGDTSGDAMVWETYWHRVEMFPYNQNPVNDNGKAKITGKPDYKYDPAAFTFKGSYSGSGTGDSTLWNNLDENNELNVDEMFSHEVSDENRILYEAKMNEDGFNYILAKQLYKSATRDQYLNETKKPANLAKYANKCNVTANDILCLPCGTDSGGEGNIEIKAAWKKLNHGEDKSRYYTNQVIHYQSVGGERKYMVEEYGLIGLHIIHKTVNFPSYVFATFEHIDNDTAQLAYIDEITQNNRGSGDTAGDTVLNVKRVHAIPSDVESVNSSMQGSSPVKGTVFENYKLVGVQAYPIDFSKLDSGNSSEVATYYLANLAIESNQELQTFRGLKSAQDDDKNNMYYNGDINMGGCMGCHGVGQISGSDFNFLIKNGPFTAPEVVGDQGTISLRNINTYADVQAMFNDYVKLNGIGINGSPHKAFWNTLSYNDFINGNVPNVGIKICTCGDSEKSAIVQILKGSYDGIGEMPFGGPYFPDEQVEKFAKWIDDGCPEK
ncbi:MAG: hypothetical protein DWQ02_15935 [Bacteroidetes bacterium]|nr:MAG: hypothetical protein DWQ02_15935 [Bacteroidota bacterium]